VEFGDNSEDYGDKDRGNCGGSACRTRGALGSFGRKRASRRPHTRYDGASMPSACRRPHAAEGNTPGLPERMTALPGCARVVANMFPPRLRRATIGTRVLGEFSPRSTTRKVRRLPEAMVGQEDDRVVVDSARTVPACGTSWCFGTVTASSSSLASRCAAPSLMGLDSHLRRCMRRQDHGGRNVLA